MLQIFTIPVTAFQQNARVLFDTDTQAATIVDPGGGVDRIWSVVESLRPQQISVLLTHGHIDHGGGAAAMLAMARSKMQSEVKLFAHPDPVLRGTISRQAKFYGLPANEYQDAPEPDSLLDEGDDYFVGSIQGKVFWTPGHAPDHLSIFFGTDQVELSEGGQTIQLPTPALIAGDVLFAGSIGRTDLPGGDTNILLQSIREKLFPLPDNTLVLPGHGPPTSIGQEKRTNPYLR